MSKTIILSLCLAFCASSAIIQEQDDTGDVCIYTFNVPREGAICAPGGAVNDNTALKSLITNQHALLEQQLNSIAEKLINIHNNTGVNSPITVNLTYTQWGKTTCPETADIIYQGFTGKSHYQHGGGVNHLCLPRDPEFPSGVTAGHQSQSYIYGTEYERHNSPLIDESLHNNDVPCAVCDVTGRTRQLMIPAKMSCPAGWTYEYDGLLMADHHTHKASDYICVAKDMEVLNGGHTNSDGGLLYVVEAVCGSLKCPPYTNGYEIACVMCTK